MKRIPHLSFLSLLAIAVLIGCRHKPDAKTELEKAADTLAKAEAELAPRPPSEPTPPEASSSAPMPQPGSLAESAGAPAASPARQMQQALASYKAGELEDAVTRLHKLRAAPTLTAEQRIAVQDSVAAVMTEVYELAAKGDGRAIQAVRQYEEMQTMPH
jgi:hypothetical protein